MPRPTRSVVGCALLVLAVAPGGARAAPTATAKLVLRVTSSPASVVEGATCTVVIRSSRRIRGSAVVQERGGQRWLSVYRRRVRGRAATLRCSTTGRAGRSLRLRVVVRRRGRTIARSKVFHVLVTMRRSGETGGGDGGAGGAGGAGGGGGDDAGNRGDGGSGGGAPPAPRPYLAQLAADTYDSIKASVEPSSGLPHDRIDGALLDIVPQLATVRVKPFVSLGPSASLDAHPCAVPGCVHSGRWGWRLDYDVPSATFASYNVQSAGFNASPAVELELWARGQEGGERFEVVLWSDCDGGFPGRPASAEIETGTSWERHAIPMADFAAHVTPGSICRLSLGFNDALDPQGTVFVDGIRFVDAAGDARWLAPDELTNVTTIGLYMASVVGARSTGLETPAAALERLTAAITALEALPTYHGFPQAHNHVVSLTPASGGDDLCISSVDTGMLAIGLAVVRQRVPELAVRAGALLDAMDWSWFYDSSVGLPYGCRFPDGTASDGTAHPAHHYDYLMADSRLAHLLGIGAGGMPASSWGNLRRLHEAPRCASESLLEPGWDGGGVFMAFLPGLFLRDTGELADSARAFIDDQICVAGQLGTPDGAWGWSATAMPPFGDDYCGFGCQRDDVLVPHAAVLALGAHVPAVDDATVLQDLDALERMGARTPFSDGARDFRWGFHASVNWQSGHVAPPLLVLDQTMVFLALTNRSTGGSLRASACDDPLVQQGTEAVPDYAGTCAD